MIEQIINGSKPGVYPHDLGRVPDVVIISVNAPEYPQSSWEATEDTITISYQSNAPFTALLRTSERGGDE